MALGKVRSLLNEPVQVGRLHVRISKPRNGVIALLICDDKNDVWLLRSHQMRRLVQKITLALYLSNK